MPAVQLTAVPVMLTTASDTSAAEAFLYNPDSISAPNTMANGITTAFGDLNIMRGDSFDYALNHSFGAETALALNFIAGLTSMGQLTEGAIQSGTTVVSAVGPASPSDFTTPTDLPTADVDVNDDTTASQYFTGIENEAAIVTQSLKNLQHLVDNGSSLATPAGNDAYESQVISDLLSFQEQINGAINAFPSVAGYGANGVLDNQLREMLITELDLNKWSANIAELISQRERKWNSGD